MNDKPIYMKILVPVIATGLIAIFAADRLHRWSGSFPPATKPVPDAPERPAIDKNSARNGRAATGWGEVRIIADETGHYHTSAEINGGMIGSVLVDTGASTVVLTYEDAETAGVFPGAAEFTVPVQTANGIGHMARTRLNRIQVGSVAVEDVDAMVAEPGALSASLLGMNFLSRLRGFSVSDGALVLNR